MGFAPFIGSRKDLLKFQRTPVKCDFCGKLVYLRFDTFHCEYVCEDCGMVTPFRASEPILTSEVKDSEYYGTCEYLNCCLGGDYFGSLLKRNSVKTYEEILKDLEWVGFLELLLTLF